MGPIAFGPNPIKQVDCVHTGAVHSARGGDCILASARGPEIITVFVKDLQTIPEPFTTHLQTIYKPFTAREGSVHSHLPDPELNTIDQYAAPTGQRRPDNTH